jgi:hypothetical protein
MFYSEALSEIFSEIVKSMLSGEGKPVPEKALRNR